MRLHTLCFKPSRRCGLVLAGILFASNAGAVSCPDGEHVQADIGRVARQYSGAGFSAALSAWSAVGAPAHPADQKKLWTATAAAQHWDEFLGGLVGGFNRCAITRQQYQEALQTLYPRLNEDGAELARLHQKRVAGQPVDEARLRQLLDREEAGLRSFARLSRMEADYDRMEAMAENRIRPRTPRTSRTSACA